MAILVGGPLLVWIDAHEAVLVRWRRDRAEVERIVSDVPARHRATGHIRHDPMVRHGGGRAQTADELHRLEHLARFVVEVASRLSPDEDVVVLGPGTVREFLARHIRESDARHSRVRQIDDEASSPRTERQLIARLRHIVGADAPRRTLGAYRWSKARIERASGHAVPVPGRVTEKRASRGGRRTLDTGERDGG